MVTEHQSSPFWSPDCFNWVHAQLIFLYFPKYFLNICLRQETLLVAWGVLSAWIAHAVPPMWVPTASSCSIPRPPLISSPPWSFFQSGKVSFPCAIYPLYLFSQPPICSFPANLLSYSTGSGFRNKTQKFLEVTSFYPNIYLPWGIESTPSLSERNRKEKLKCFRSWGRTTLQIQLYSRNKHFTLQMKLHSGSDHWMATIYVCKELIFFQFALVLLWAFLVARRIYLGRIWRPVLFVDSCLESLLVLKINSPWC